MLAIGLFTALKHFHPSQGTQSLQVWNFFKLSECVCFERYDREPLELKTANAIWVA